MTREAARAEGKRVVTALLRKIRQDTGNAKWIGRMALATIERRRPGSSPATGADDPGPAAQPSSEVTTAPSTPRLVAAWSILSTTELVDYLATCDIDVVHAILREEREQRARAAIIDAAQRRLA